MSSKTRTRKTRAISTAGSTRALRSVPDQLTITKVRTDAEDKLGEALHATPNSTAADLASAAKIGKSTAQKILVRWAGDGSVTRTAGIAEGGRRAADLWAITEVAGDSVDDSTTTTGVGSTTPVDPDMTDIDEATPAEGDPTGSTSTEPTGTAAEDAQDITDSGVPNRADAEPVVTEVNEPAADDPAIDGSPATEGDRKEKSARLAPGALRGMVEDYLREHPGEEFGPTAIAKALGGKSSGAVSNTLDKLAADGTVIKTKESPRRFALAPAEQAADPAPTN